LLIRNEDQRSKDYGNIRCIPSVPAHADDTYWQKYGIRDHRGGGRSPRAKLLLPERPDHCQKMAA